MGDIYVQVRMKQCCREVLRRIDEEKNKAGVKEGILGAGALAEMLGERTIDAAMAAIPGGRKVGGLMGEMERVTRALCAKICEMHAAEHEAAGEGEEAGFWRALLGTFSPT
jgi:hypothetical protein